MKLKRKLFESLEAERKKAQDTALMAECAIHALRELCDHDWVEDICHGYGEDPPQCAICGKIKNPN